MSSIDNSCLLDDLATDEALRRHLADVRLPDGRYWARIATAGVVAPAPAAIPLYIHGTLPPDRSAPLDGPITWDLVWEVHDPRLNQVWSGYAVELLGVLQTFRFAGYQKVEPGPALTDWRGPFWRLVTAASDERIEVQLWHQRAYCGADARVSAELRWSPLHQAPIPGTHGEWLDGPTAATTLPRALGALRALRQRPPEIQGVVAHRGPASFAERPDAHSHLLI
jgi:hypothetical protein